MSLDQIYQLKHELWLKILFSSFALKDEKHKSYIYDMANIEFRHMKWLSNKLKDENIEYNYNKDDSIDIQQNSSFDYFHYIINQIKQVMKYYDPQDPLYARILSDEYYFISVLESWLQDKSNDYSIDAFNKQRVYEGKKLDKLSTDALTIFLFEETYKEYELILIYAYMQNYTDDIIQYNVYQDLVDESQFHLKSFGNMLAKMGLLSIPRSLFKELYQRIDIKQFLIDGIDEEKAAKEECKKLAEAIDDEELSKFFDFINYQENYHIELMEKTLKVFS